MVVGAGVGEVECGEQFVDLVEHALDRCDGGREATVVEPGGERDRRVASVGPGDVRVAHRVEAGFGVHGCSSSAGRVRPYRAARRPAGRSTRRAWPRAKRVGLTGTLVAAHHRTHRRWQRPNQRDSCERPGRCPHIGAVRGRDCASHAADSAVRADRTQSVHHRRPYGAGQTRRQARLRALRSGRADLSRYDALPVVASRSVNAAYGLSSGG